METRCDVCLQPATKKCTACGKVFCDLHIRYGGQAGGMYGGGNVGHYCDACWESQIVRRRRARQMLVVLGVVLLLFNLAGLLLLRGDGFLIPSRSWIAGTVVILAVIMLAVLVGVKVWVRRR